MTLRSFHSFTAWLICAVALSTAAQDIQPVDVRGFTGGLVTGVSNSLVPDNACIALSNYDITPFGELKRRKGFTLHGADALYGVSGNKDVWFIVPSRDSVQNNVGLIRRHGTTFSGVGDTANKFSLAYTLYNKTNGTCTTGQAYGFRDPDRVDGRMNGFYRTGLKDYAIFGADNSPMTLCDAGGRIIEARPRAVGEPRVTGINSAGVLSGTFRYIYGYVDTSNPRSALSGKYSGASAVSRAVSVIKGKAFLYGIEPPDSQLAQNADFIGVYRRNENGLADTGLGGEDRYWEIAKLPVATTEWVDNNADTFTYLSGLNAYYTSPGWGGVVLNGSFSELNSPWCCPPGAPVPSFGGFVSGGMNLASGSYEFRYAIEQENVFGKRGSISEPAIIAFSGPSTTNEVKLRFPPAPNSAYKRYLLKSIDASNYGRILLRWDDTIYYDKSASAVSPIWGTAGDFNNGDTAAAPDAITVSSHLSRAYAGGTLSNPSRLYYSEFGRPDLWPTDHFIELSDPIMGRITNLIDFNDMLVIARTRTILSLQGASFFQYSLDNAVLGSAGILPHGVVALNSGVTFLTENGVYAIGENAPLSQTIERSFDSLVSSPSNMRAISRVGDELWLYDRNYTKKGVYILALTPQAHWRYYDLYVRDIARFDWDTTMYDIDRERYLIAGANGQPYDLTLRYDPRGTDTSDGGVQFTSTFQTKYFFDDGARERVAYFELYGTGNPGQMTLYVYKNFGTLAKTITINPDFTDNVRDRYRIDLVCDNISFKVSDPGAVASYAISGYSIGVLPQWDGGKQK